MPGGKPAGVPCVQLDAAGACRLFGHPSRPAVCSGLQPSLEMCGSSRAEAMLWLARLEAATAPASAGQPAGAAAASAAVADRGCRASHQRSKK
ncbi:hypothetical protein AQPW35_39110 [Rubrivivax pictus]|uniref:Proteinase inhibitor n=1 Tax=Pseudaquabacterium pictum TaxID=2315236 RepID=A0A480AV92_9BURK|nr:hypothetical protein AQPW35_39110 [Rubrivivax pictus]